MVWGDGGKKRGSLKIERRKEKKKDRGSLEVEVGSYSIVLEVKVGRCLALSIVQLAAKKSVP